jgi:choline dehydrogenase
VSYPNYLWPQSVAWFEALEALGIPKSLDPNDGSNAGGYFLPLSIDPDQQTRSDARTAYYDPASRRPNFNVITNAQVTRIIFEDGFPASPVSSAPPYANYTGPVKRHYRRQDPSSLVATAIEFAAEPSAPRQTVYARREIILAAGAIHTPQLLELSGIGSSAVLSSLNITTLIDLPGVGNNLQDHAMIHLNYQYKNNSIPTPDDLLTNSSFNAVAEQEYLSSRTGPWTAKPSTAVAFPSLSQIIPQTLTNYTIALASLVNSTLYLSPPNTHPSVLAGYNAQLPHLLTSLRSPNVPAYEILNDNSGGLDLALMRPLSRGDTHITSPDPFMSPAINPNWLSHPLDVAIMGHAIRFNQALLLTPQLSSMQPTFNLPDGVPFDPTDAQIEEILKTRVATEFHVSCSCAMLPRELGGVVDSALKVYGTGNLRVVDASVFPVVPGAHLMGVVVAVGEKAVDIIRGVGAGIDG